MHQNILHSVLISFFNKFILTAFDFLVIKSEKNNLFYSFLAYHVEADKALKSYMNAIAFEYTILQNPVKSQVLVSSDDHPKILRKT